MTNNPFKEMRDRFAPENPSVIFVLESPPLGHGFVYDPEGKVGEVLFRAFMKLANLQPINKWDGLNLLMERRWVLTNAIYEPVNKLPDKRADEMIRRNFPDFLKDLEKLTNSNKKVPIVLIKKNICEILEPLLVDSGYEVLNRGKMIPFPLHYHAESFQTKVLKLLSLARL